MMVNCRYRLPCGDCDKYDTKCKSTVDDIIDYNVLIGEISSGQAEKIKEEIKSYCQHEWRYATQSAVGHHYICIKCGDMKSVPLENIYSDDLYSTDKECNHDWHINGRLFGKNERYTMHTCSKCGKEETLKTYMDEDGKWITHSV